MLKAETAADMSMQIHRASTTVSGDGSVTINDLPFSCGEEVEVIVLPSRQPQANKPSDRLSLRGSVREYARPFESAVDADEWDAA